MKKAAICATFAVAFIGSNVLVLAESAKSKVQPASRAARSLVEETPSNPEQQAKAAAIQALQDKAKTEANNGNWQKCADYLEQALECKPDIQKTATLLEDLIDAHNRIGGWSRAEIFHRQLASMSTSPANAKLMPWTAANPHQQLYLAAVCALNQGHYETAISTLRDLIAEIEKKKKVDFPNSSTEPEYADCLFLLGNATLDGAAKYKEALLQYDKCLHTEGALNKNAAPSSQSQVLYRSPEMQANLLICCSKTGDTGRATKLREKLKQDIRAYLASTTNASRSAGAEALSLLDKGTLSRAEEIRLMEVIPQVLFAGSPKLGESDHLLLRALVIRLCSKPISTQAVSNDYTSLSKLYLNHFESKAAQPYCWLRVQYLKKNNASESEIAQARADWDQVCKK